MISEEQFDRVCKEVESTSDGIFVICKRLSISTSEFYLRLNSSDKYSKRYARAKELQVEPLLNDISRLQEECLREIKTIDDPRKCNALQSAYREQIRHIEWVIAKLLPKKYGDKLEVDNNHNFPDGININFTRENRKPKQDNKSDDQQC